MKNIKKTNLTKLALTTIVGSMMIVPVFADDVMMHNQDPDISFYSNYLDSTYNEPSSDIVIGGNPDQAQDTSNNVIIGDGTESIVQDMIKSNNFSDVNYYMYVKENAKILSDSNPNSSKVKDVKRGDYVHVIKEDFTGSTNMVNVEYNEVNGYIPKSLLSSDRIYKTIDKEILIKNDTKAYLDDRLSKEEFSLTAGDMVYATSESKDVTIIKKNKKHYYIKTEDTSLNRTFSKNTKTIEAKSTGNILLTPNNGSTTVNKIMPGEKIEQVESNGEWAKVKVDENFEGFIRLEDLQLMEEGKTPNNTKENSSAIDDDDNQFAYDNYDNEDTVNVTSGDAIVDTALQYVGNRYVWGGNSLTKGTDCSGFTKLIYAKYGYDLPRYSGDQRNVGRGVSLSEAKPGDIVCYPGHVAIYMGNERIVHASTPRGGIKTGSVYIGKRILTIRRIID